MKLRIASLFFLLICVSVPSLSAVPDSTSGSDAVPDFESIIVQWDEQRSGRFAYVEPWPGNYVRALRKDGTAEYIDANRIRLIVDDQGQDATRFVLELRESVGLRPPSQLDVW